MKRNRLILTPLALLVLLTASYGEDRLSAATKRLLARLPASLATAEMAKKPVLISEAFKSDFGLQARADGYAVRALMKINGRIREADLTDLNIGINSRLNDIWSVEIPISALRVLTKMDGFDYLEIDTHVSTRLDSVREETGVDAVHAGIGLAQAYDGTGVVLGIIDGGFDYTHPTFENAAGQAVRISRVWDQADGSGNPPSSFSYGSEIVGPGPILAAESDTEASAESHGTHVAGIAGGQGTGSGGTMTGIAPGTELVFVNIGGGGSSIADAVNYIFSYAETAGKPAVVNMSLGSHYGPHDGTSLLDQLFDSLAGPGKILVGAAGNEGDTPLHLSHSFSGDTVATIADLAQMSQTTWGSDIEMWGSKNSDFAVAVALFDSAAGSVLAQSPFLTAGSGIVDSVSVFSQAGESAYFFISATGSAFNNQKPNIQIQLHNTTDHKMAIIVTSGNTTLHMWNAAEMPFSDLGMSGVFRSGDNEYTVGEVGGTSQSIITVGSYTTKKRWQDFQGNNWVVSATVGAISDFSSHGPTVDGRVKPDITAPGEVVASAVSSFDVTLIDPRTVSVVDETWPYYVLQGTSMASPVVAGVVALMLQANPALSASDIVGILKSTGRQDAFTGAIPGSGSTIWGFGKIDAHAAVLQADATTSVLAGAGQQPSEYRLENNYPNPFNPVTHISFYLPTEGVGSLKIYDVGGREVATLVQDKIDAGSHVFLFDASQLSSGVYFYRLAVGQFDLTKKMVLLK